MKDQGYFKWGIIIDDFKRVGNLEVDIDRLMRSRTIGYKQIVVYKQIYFYLHTHSLIPSSQSGFRLAHSCETSLLKLQWSYFSIW